MCETSYYEVKRPLPIGKNKKVIALMKNELVEEIMMIREIKKAKDSKKCIIKCRLKFADYRNTEFQKLKMRLKN